MARTPKVPEPRGFTLAEVDGLRFERATLWGVGGVTLVAFVISFTALAWVGAEMGMPNLVNYLVPVAVDGFAIVCTIGIARNKISRMHAAWEWLGLIFALALSIVGNVHHAVVVGSPDLPYVLKVAFGAAVPIFVALGIHIYGRAMTSGLRTHIMAGDPDKLHQPIWQVGEDQPATAAAGPRAPRKTSAPARAAAPKQARESAQPNAQPVRADAPSIAQPARVDAHDLPATKEDAEAAVRAAVREIYAQTKDIQRGVAKELFDRFAVDRFVTQSTHNRWVAQEAEACKLEDTPAAIVTPASDRDDQERATA